MFPMGRISDYSHPIKNITVSHNNSLTNSEQSKGIFGELRYTKGIKHLPLQHS